VNSRLAYAPPVLELMQKPETFSTSIEGLSPAISHRAEDDQHANPCARRARHRLTEIYDYYAPCCGRAVGHSLFAGHGWPIREASDQPDGSTGRWSCPEGTAPST